MLRQAKDALDELSADEVAGIQAEQQELAELSYELHLSAAKREGRVEGHAEGKADLLQRLLTLKFGQLTSEISARLANASEAQLGALVGTVAHRRHLGPRFLRIARRNA